MYVYLAGTNTRVGQSAGGTNEESFSPTAAGSYDVYIVMFAKTTPDIPQINLHAFVVPAGAAGNLTVTPASQAVTTGTPVTITASWSGLTPGARYLGIVSYGDGTSALGQTVVAIY
jgi:hypothetical protein